MAHLSRLSSSLGIHFTNPLLLRSWLPIGKSSGGGTLHIDVVQPQHGQDFLTMFIGPVTSLQQPGHVVSRVDSLLKLVRPLPGQPFALLQGSY